MTNKSEDRTQSITNLAFADEAWHNTGRFRSVAAVTMKATEAMGIRDELVWCLEKSGIREFKWAKLRTAQYRFAALHLLDFIIDAILTNRIRVDVLLWDTEDSRHRIPGRCDVRNLRRMYYFLFRNVLLNRWPLHAVWAFYPDENSAVNWDSIGFYLEEVIDFESGELKAELDIPEIVQTRSESEPFIQICDLFAGLAVFSRASYEKLAQWLVASSSNVVAESGPIVVSNADRERFIVIKYLNNRCKHYKLGISLVKSRGLRSFNPEKPINFWWYEPQGDYDRAPTY
ncbi:MAG: DUF3800 domain-containing protein [Bacillota bacterium]